MVFESVIFPHAGSMVKNKLFDEKLFIAHTQERMKNLVGKSGKLATKIFNSFLGVGNERFFIGIYIYHSDERNSSINFLVSISENIRTRV